jgi:hypothetical protein
VEEIEMKKTWKIVFLMTLVMSLLMTNFVTAADPVVTTEPEDLVKQSTFTLMAEIDDENILSVWLRVQECDASTGICFPDTVQNLSMAVQDSKYQTEVTITHERASYVQYTIYVETDEGWITYLEDKKIYLTEEQNGDGTGNGDDDDNGSPGFELITVFVAIIIGVILLNRKRY